MQSFNNLRTSLEEGIYTITIDRPGKMNALSIETLQELYSAMENVYDNKEIKGVIITGEGEKAFVAGADITEISELTELNARKFSEDGHEIFDKIELCPKPVIAAVNGFALGGGFELALACHMRVAVYEAKFGLPEVKLGIVPGFGGTQRLTQMIGKGKALEMMMTGSQVLAEEAKNLGLLNYVVPKEELIEKSREILHNIQQNAPLAIEQVVECVNAVYKEEVSGFQVEANAFTICVKTHDFQEGTKAFLEKRKPQFKGE